LCGNNRGVDGGNERICDPAAARQSFCQIELDGQRTGNVSYVRWRRGRKRDASRLQTPCLPEHTSSTAPGNGEDSE